MENIVYCGVMMLRPVLSCATVQIRLPTHPSSFIMLASIVGSPRNLRVRHASQYILLHK